MRRALTTTVMTYRARTGIEPQGMTHHVLGDPRGSMSIVFKGHSPERMGPILSWACALIVPEEHAAKGLVPWHPPTDINNRMNAYRMWISVCRLRESQRVRAGQVLNLIPGVLDGTLMRDEYPCR